MRSVNPSSLAANVHLRGYKERHNPPIGCQTIDGASLLDGAEGGRPRTKDDRKQPVDASNDWTFSFYIKQ